MGNLIGLTAVVTGYPSNLRRPSPLPGESALQMVLRNYGREWENLLESLTKEFDLSQEDAKQLRAGGEPPKLDRSIHRQINNFINFRVPCFQRTMKCLVDLREDLTDTRTGVELVEILWPRVGALTGEGGDAGSAEELGVTVLPACAGSDDTLDLVKVLPHVHGEFVWFVPGGTLFMASLVAMSLGRVLRYLAGTPRRAFYFDGESSEIYRVSALRELAASGGIPAETREVARRLQETGYELMIERDPDSVLCDLERQYGGSYSPYSAPPAIPWWRRLLGI